MYLVSFVGVPLREDHHRGFSPLIDDSVEVEIDEVGGFGARLDAFGIAAPNLFAPESRQCFLGAGELQPIASISSNVASIGASDGS